VIELPAMETPKNRRLASRAFPFLHVLIVGAISCGCSDQKAKPANDGAPEGLALTPPMGFNDWNAFGCDVSETLIKETADVIVSSGLKDAGYEFVNIDDCWSLRERGADGRLVPDPAKFPSGIQGVADYVHDLGLKLGIYGDAGTQTCAGYPGSLGHETIDAATWAEWGVDYLKYDNCNNQSDGSRDDYVRRYTAMRDALRDTGRPIVYSICEWGTSQPWLWAPEVGQLWRTTGDIADTWSSIRSIIASNSKLAQYAGPGHWNDPDMLEIGNGGMTTTEYRTHMSMWAMMAAPLIIGTDLREASAETLDILSNPELIAINQDALGKQGDVVQNAGGLMVLDKPLASGEHALAFYNSTDAIATIAVQASETGLPPAAAYRLVDASSGTALKFGTVLAAGVAAHGTVVYRASPVAEDERLPPAVALGATHETLIAGLEEGATLTTEVENLGIDAAVGVEVGVTAPDGWTVTAVDASTTDALEGGDSFETTFRIEVPEGTTPGRHAIGIFAAYRASDEGDPVTLTNEVLAVVVAAPPDGTTHLARLVPVSAENGLGPVELDLSNGDSAEGDGSLLTIEGRIYTHGLGTRSPSDIAYYLGGRCSSLTTDVGIDDQASASGSATFTIYADDTVVAESEELTFADEAVTLDADLTGATWLRLVTDPGAAVTGDYADWAMPLLVCGDTTEPSSPELTLFSFESGTDGFTTANPDGGSVEQSEDFHTDGSQGLEVTAPENGNWFGQRFSTPVDLSALSTLKVDLKTDTTGTPGELAIQIGAANAWCQASLWTWTNPNRTATIKRSLSDLACPAGATRDLTQVRAVWVFLKAGTFQIDNVRAE
jgi:alpha-galactosidase